MKDSETDVAIYWTSLRVFTKKLSALLNDLQADGTWEKFTHEWPDERKGTEGLRVSKQWSMGFTSATNTLAALLKVSVPTLVGFGGIERDRMSESSWLTFGRNLHSLSSELLADFDATVAK